MISQLLASATLPEGSLWGEISPGEIVLLIAGALLTLVMVGFLVFVAVRASRRSS